MSSRGWETVGEEDPLLYPFLKYDRCQLGTSGSIAQISGIVSISGTTCSL
jgi:hypothetical protein